MNGPMLVTVQFRTDTAAFEDVNGPFEVANVLGRASYLLSKDRAANGGKPRVFSAPLTDSHGNEIGVVKVDHG